MKTDQLMSDTITYANEVLNLLDVLKAVELGDLTELDSVKTVIETAYNMSENLYNCVSDLDLELRKEEADENIRNN